MTFDVRTVCGSGGILFLAIGARQGFGLFLDPVMTDIGLSREEFSAAVATQYLVWGIAAPAASHLSSRIGIKAVLYLAAFLYAAGFAGAGWANDFLQFWLSAGVLIGLGLGCASFGIVHGVVARATPAHARGRALGEVGAITAAGQLSMLFVTGGSISHFGWQAALFIHAVCVALIAVAAYSLPSAHTSRGGEIQQSWKDSIAPVICSALFWRVALPFAASGFQVMATMTHLPAFASDLGYSADVAVNALVCVSATSFLGSWYLGKLGDLFGPSKVLVWVYVCRGVLALVLATASLSEVSLLIYFAVVGVLWMSPIPLTSHLTAETFGPLSLPTVFGVVLLVHQVFGAVGTYVAGHVREVTGTYTVVWILCGAACLASSTLLRMPIRQQV